MSVGGFSPSSANALAEEQLPEVGRQVGKAYRSFRDTAEDLRKSVEPELNVLQQEVKMAEQDFQASMKETEEEISAATKPAEEEPKTISHSGQA